MVSLTQRDTFILEAQKDPELRPLRAFVFGERVGEPIPGATTRSKLFDALRRNDSQQFRQTVADVERRKLSADSDWIGDDCVVFLLLLGVSKFDVGGSLADKLLQFRAKTTNPQAQRVNHAFEAIRRREFAMEGEGAFIKCAYRVLSETWSPSDSDCAKLYKQLTTPGFLDQWDPFLRLLAIRAFDLVIESRSVSLDPGNWNQVLQRLQDEGAKLSLVQFFRLLKHLRVGVVVAIAMTLPTVFGAGRLWSWWSSKPSAPERVTVSGPLLVHSQLSDGSNGWTAPFVRYLEDTGSGSSNFVAKTLVAQTEPFVQPTKRFTAKGTLASAVRVNGFCFLMHPVDGVMSSVPVDVFCSSNTFVASVPPAAAGDWLQFFLRGELSKTSAGTNMIKFPLTVTAGP